MAVTPQDFTTILPIVSIEPFTFQDYPGKMACILWFAGCNFRCPYCHNPDLLTNIKRQYLTPEQVLEFLTSRQGELEGVVLSGGECTLFKEMPLLLRAIKDLNFAVKIDTNGTDPDLIKTIVEQGLVDFIGLDFKASPSKFMANTQQTQQFYERFLESLRYLVGCSGVTLEVRTTVHTDLLDEDAINEMIDILDEVGYRGTYYLQNFFANPQKSILDMSLDLHPRHLDANRIKQPLHFQVDYRG